jgi:hypothetical protein
MADLVFNQNEINSLCAKVSTLQPQLSDPERALLLAIFAAAAERARPIGPKNEAALPLAVGSTQAPDAQPNAASLQQQLLNSYVAGNSFSDVVGGGGVGRVN